MAEVFDCKKCPAVHGSAAESYDHLVLHHGLTGPSSVVVSEDPVVFKVSPLGLADQFGLPTYAGE